MKYSLQLIGTYVDLTGVDHAWLVEQVTRSVAEVESRTTLGAGLDAVRIARIRSIAPHPQAATLSVCEVDDGDASRTVVCGAPNARPGLITALAPPGARLRGREVAEKSFHGVLSAGVLCSPKELELTDAADAICELPDNAPVGRPLSAILPVQDTVFEVDNKSLTHRPDLWSHVGMAREIAAILRRPVRWPDLEESFGSEQPPAVTVEAADACPRYSVLRFDVPAIAPSPLWLQTWLHRTGVRPTSNVVDLTNFVMIEWGNPVHAFDAREVRGNRIVVRHARDRETVETLDRVRRELTSADLLICDAERPIALAGVMGLANSEIGDATTQGVLEVATFRADVIRRTAMRLRFRTEASARFEKSLDPDLPPLVCRRFAQLLRQVAPESRVVSRLGDVYAGRPPLPVIDTSVSYINERLGTSLSPGSVVATLESLAFSVTETDGNLRVVVPGHRATRDISIAEDLVEEVGRLFGYDKIQPVHPRAPLPKPHRDPTLAFHRELRAVLSYTSGLNEIQAYSFDPEPLLARIGRPETPRIAVRNPITADATHLRSRLLPGLLAALEQNRGVCDRLRVYEIGRVFRASREGIPDQPYHLGLLTWRRHDTRWATAQADAVGDLKAVLAEVSARLRLTLTFADVQEPQPWLHPARVANVRLANGRVVGSVGALHPRICDLLGVGPFAAAAELDLDLVQAADRDLPLYEPVIRLPPLPVDVSLVVPYRVTHQQILATIDEAKIDVLRRVDYVGSFTGDPIPAGHKSVTYRLLFQSAERTLAKEEVLALVDRLVTACRERLGASLRSSTSLT